MKLDESNSSRNVGSNPARDQALLTNPYCDSRLFSFRVPSAVSRPGRTLRLSSYGHLPEFHSTVAKTDAYTPGEGKSLASGRTN